MTDEPSVLVDVDADGVALVTLNRPHTLNAMTAEMQQRYCRTLAAADLDPAVRAIVVTGAGRGFCSGADLSTLAGIAAADSRGATAGRGPASEPGSPADPVPGAPFGSAPGEDEVAFDAPLQLSTPVIAAVNGPVAGMGFSYMLMADLRFASDTARMGSTFARLGLVAEWGSAPLLTALVGSAHAKDLLLSGRIVDAAEALALGLVQRVYPADALVEETLTYARDLARNCAPSSMAIMLRQLRQASLREQFAESVTLMLDSFSGPDLPEALAARTQKRAPRFAPHPAPAAES